MIAKESEMGAETSIEPHTTPGMPSPCRITPQTLNAAVALCNGYLRTLTDASICVLTGMGQLNFNEWISTATQ
jgi:hypothetical protein